MGSLAEISMLLNAKGNQQISSLSLGHIKSLEQDDEDEDSSKYFKKSLEYSWSGAEKHVFSSFEVIRGIKHPPGNKETNVTKQSPKER